MSEPKTTWETQKEFAKEIDISPGKLSGWLHRRDWPVRTIPPWNADELAKVLRWRETCLRKNRNTGEPGSESLRDKKLHEEIRKTHYQANQAEIIFHRERGRLLDADDVEAGYAKLGARLRTAFSNAAMSIVPLALRRGMPTQESDQFRHEVEQVIYGVLRLLSSEEEAETSDDSDGVAPVLAESMPAGATEPEPMGGEVSVSVS